MNIFKRYEKEDQYFILRVPVTQTTVMYDPHRLNEYLESDKEFPNPEDWQHTLLYTSFVAVNDLFLGQDVMIPMKKNPRNQNLKSPVSNNIANALISNELEYDDDNQVTTHLMSESFYIHNRGIALVASKVKKMNDVIFLGEEENIYSEVLEIYMNEEKEGNIDGGHTYKIILEQVEKQLNLEKKLNAFVRLEVNVNLRNVTNFAEARNTNAAVKDASIMNSRGEFSTIKTLLEGLPFYERIAYRQNDEGFPVENIIEYIELFNLKKSPLFEPSSDEIVVPKPVLPKHKWGAAKKDILKYYSDEINSAISEERPSEYDYMEPIISDIFWLYSHIEKNISKIYRQYAKQNKKGNFSALSYVSHNDTKEKKLPNGIAYRQLTTYSDGLLKEENVMPFVVDKGLVVPLAGMFRMLLDRNKEGYYQWISGVDIHQDADKIIGNVIEETMIAVGEAGPDGYAKDKGTWTRNLLTLSQYRMAIRSKESIS